jgi:hypothetical protein
MLPLGFRLLSEPEHEGFENKNGGARTIALVKYFQRWLLQRIDSQRTSGCQGYLKPV